MNKKILPVVVVLLMVASFFAGSAVTKKKLGDEAKLSTDTQATVTTAPSQNAQPPFNPTKSKKPEIKFFVMSFCPYGNVAEDGLEPVYQLLKDKVTWSPRYIVSVIDQTTIDGCKQSCPQRVGNEEAKKKCQEAIDAKQLAGMDADTCVKQYFPYKTADECIKAECSALKPGTYESLHGGQELNQDVREICAYNLGNVEKWWKFVSLVNKKCNSNDADTCWQAQAKEAGLNTDKITACEKNQLTALVKKEIAETEKYKASGSPSVFINEAIYNGGRAPEDYKKAVCSAFENPPKECETVLGQESAAASGGCE